MTQVSANTRRFAERNTAQVKHTLNKAGTAIAEVERRSEQSASTAANAGKTYYLKVLDIARENTLSGFDLARELAAAETPSQVIEAWNAHARGLLETFSKQAQELVALTQNMAMTPLTKGLTTPFRLAE